MSTAVPRLPLHLEDAEVFEGFGLVPAGTTTSVSTVPAPSSPPRENLILGRTAGPSPTRYESRVPFDRDDALRQLKLALGVDVPPQLSPVPPPVEPHPTRQTASSAQATAPPPVLYVTKTVAASSVEQVSDQLRAWRAECTAVEEWLATYGVGTSGPGADKNESPPGAPSSLVRVQQALCSPATVEELLARVKGIDRAQRCWPITCDTFAALMQSERRRTAHAANAEPLPASAPAQTSSEALTDTAHLIASLHEVELELWRLAPLLARFRRVEPALREAAHRQATFAAAVEMTSAACQTGLQSMITDTERLTAEMTLAAERIVANRAAVRARVAALKGT